MTAIEELAQLRHTWNIPLKKVPQHVPVSYRTVLRWRSTGKLAVRRVGGRVVTSAEAILAACPLEGGTPAGQMLRDQNASAASRRVLAMLGKGGR